MHGSNKDECLQTDKSVYTPDHFHILFSFTRLLPTFDISFITAIPCFIMLSILQFCCVDTSLLVFTIFTFLHNGSIHFSSASHQQVFFYQLVTLSFPLPLKSEPLNNRLRTATPFFRLVLRNTYGNSGFLRALVSGEFVDLFVTMDYVSGVVSMAHLP